VIEEGPRAGDTGTFCGSSFQLWIRRQQCRSQRRAARKYVIQDGFVDPESLRTKVGIHLLFESESSESTSCIKSSAHWSQYPRTFELSHSFYTLRRGAVLE